MSTRAVSSEFHRAGVHGTRFCASRHGGLRGPGDTSLAFGRGTLATTFDSDSRGHDRTRDRHGPRRSEQSGGSALGEAVSVGELIRCRIAPHSRGGSARASAINAACGTSSPLALTLNAPQLGHGHRRDGERPLSRDRPVGASPRTARAVCRRGAQVSPGDLGSARVGDVSRCWDNPIADLASRARWCGSPSDAVGLQSGVPAPSGVAH
jgi:hypothetical protein